MGALLNEWATTTQAQAEAERSLNGIKANIRAFEERLKKAEQRKQVKAAAQVQADLEDLYRAQTAKQRELDKVKPSAEAATLALFKVREKRYQHREHVVRTAIDLPDNMALRVNWNTWAERTSWELLEVRLDHRGQWVMKQARNEQTGEAFSHPDYVFTHSVTVRGPERRLWQGDWQAATVNWGASGSIEIADAEALIKLHSLAVRLASFLERVKLQWADEDAAD